MEEIELLESIKFLLLCKNDCQAIRLIEKYGYWKKQEGLKENSKLDGNDSYDAFIKKNN
jgi:hypothetical protein